eukprot:scaffold12824_cov26-Tisochrysis_lutea.AAC.1
MSSPLIFSSSLAGGRARCASWDGGLAFPKVHGEEGQQVRPICSWRCANTVARSGRRLAS